MSMPAKRLIASISGHGLPAHDRGIKYTTQWPLSQSHASQKRRHTRLPDPTDNSDSGSEPWMADIPGEPTGIQQLAAQDSVLPVNMLTAVAHGSEAAVGEYMAELEKRNHALWKNNSISCPHNQIPGVLGHQAIPVPSADDPYIYPDSDFNSPSTLPALAITHGDFLHKYLKVCDATARRQISTHLHLPSGGFKSPLNILSFHNRQYLNGVVNNPTLGNIGDLLEHIRFIGNGLAAEGFGCFNSAASEGGTPAEVCRRKERATNNIAVLVGIRERIMSSWLGSNAVEDLSKNTPIRLKAQDHWRGKQLGWQIAKAIEEWAKVYLKEKRWQVFRDAIDDGIVPGMEQLEKNADKQDVDSKHAEMQAEIAFFKSQIAMLVEQRSFATTTTPAKQPLTKKENNAL
ncbi:hypothetical protein DFH27DRAFT_614825 [Peziza echinospora]|nr:hypothetical protein DFH27DRAFT_614825 [Peziza echinospora]